MPCNFKLIVGLGNPTLQYAKTRHNAGFWVLDRLADQYRVVFSVDSRTQSRLACLDIDGEKIFLLKPMQFMNRSGVAVAALARFYRIMPDQILVVHDELDFEPGIVKLKRGGGHGGHNGLRDIISCLGAADFWRLRIGIGHPGDRGAVIGYVLTSPPQSQLSLLEAAMDRAMTFFPGLIAGQRERVMNEMHARV